jgi:plastocyanin
MRTIARSVFAVALVAVSLVTAAPALAGGGGCAELTHGSGSVVRIEDACFTPSIISIPAGDSVTFVNEDPFAHNVSGAGWGHYADLRQGGRFTMKFTGEGLYPFACTLHPGMNGVVRVGDGAGPGNGDAVVPQLIATPTNNLEPPGSAVGEEATDGWNLPGIPLALLAGVGIGLGVAVLRRRATGSVAAVPR